jgi:DNA-binding winged helix-turn-helix (wHTH) protein/tetratricopeptide (TPR) repeat protein
MSPQESSGSYLFDEFRLDPLRGALLGPDGAELRLRPKAFALLRHFLENQGRLLGREELIETLWPGVMVTDDSLTQCIGELRRAFGDRAGDVLRTVPKRGYVLAAKVRSDAAPRQVVLPASEQAAPSRPVATRRQDQVAVFRFEAPDGDRDSALFADGLAGDLIVELAHVEGLRVMAGADAAVAEGYRVRGEVRASEAELRVLVRLEDAATGEAVWADRLGHPREALLGLSKEMLAALVAHIDQQVERHSISVARRKPPAALTAREFCLLGRDHHQRGTEADTLVAKEMFARAIEADPDYATAYAWQAYTVHRAITHGWGSPGGQAARDESLRLSRKAVQLQPDSPLCLSRLAFSLILHQRWEEAVAAARSALSASRPAFAAARNTCCEVLAAAGHPEEAVAVARETIARDPLCPPTTQGILGRALLLIGKVEEALPPLRFCASRLPDYAATYDSLLVAALESGRVSEALAARDEFFRIKPGWVPRNHTGYWFFRHAEDVERFEASYRQAAKLAGEAGGEPAPDEEAQASGAGRATPPAEALALLRQDTLVVQPLQVTPSDDAAADAAATLASDLAAELVRHEDLRIVGVPDRGAARGYSLKGEVHSAEGRLHAVIRLDDLETGLMFWSKRLEWPSGQAAGLLAGEAGPLAAAINVQVSRRSLRRARQKRAEQLTARELTLLGRDIYDRGTEAGTRAARDMFVRAAATDPDYAAAHAWHAIAITRIALNGWSDQGHGEAVEDAVRLARHAVELEPESPHALSALSLCLALGEHWVEAVVSARLALRTDRMADIAVRMSCGAVLAAAGHPEEAEEVLRQMIAWDPHCPPVAHGTLGRVLLLCGRPEEALAELRLCAVHLPDYVLNFRAMVVAAMEAGLLEEARKALGEVRRLRPGWVNGTEPIFWFLRRPEDRERHRQAFETAMHLEAAAKAGGLLVASPSRA